MSNPTLREQLARAKIIMVDDDAGLWLAWFGGHGIHAYTDSGREVAFWQVGYTSSGKVSPATIRASMRARMKAQDYGDFSGLGECVCR